MLLVAVTGGIGSGKSTLSSALGDCGACVVDADQIAREVVQPGSAALSEIVARFGQDVLRDGALDRGALGALVFADPVALAALESITHPQIRARFHELLTTFPANAVVVHEVPLLGEKALGDQYHLVLGVEATMEHRRARLAHRGLSDDEIDQRLAHQLSDVDRRRHCDIIFTNDSTEADLYPIARQLWQERLLPFAANIENGTAADRGDALVLMEHQSQWIVEAERLVGRIRRAIPNALRVDHVGSTSVPGLIAKDVIDIQVTVSDLDDVNPDDLLAAGFASTTVTADLARPSDPDPAHWRKKFFTSCDPGRAVNVHVRTLGSPGERFARLFPEWLRAVPEARERYSEIKRTLAQTSTLTEEYAEAKEPWFSAEEGAMLEWAAGRR